jgi:hypothetical protein
MNPATGLFCGKTYVDYVVKWDEDGSTSREYSNTLVKINK